MAAALRNHLANPMEAPSIELFQALAKAAQLPGSGEGTAVNGGAASRAFPDTAGAAGAGASGQPSGQAEAANGQAAAGAEASEALRKGGLTTGSSPAPSASEPGARDTAAPPRQHANGVMQAPQQPPGVRTPNGMEEALKPSGSEGSSGAAHSSGWPPAVGSSARAFVQADAAGASTRGGPPELAAAAASASSPALVQGGREAPGGDGREAHLLPERGDSVGGAPSSSSVDRPHPGALPPTARAAAGPAETIYRYDLGSSDTLDAYMRNIRRRIEVELEDGCTVQVCVHMTR